MFTRTFKYVNKPDGFTTCQNRKSCKAETPSSRAQDPVKLYFRKRLFGFLKKPVNYFEKLLTNVLKTKTIVSTHVQRAVEHMLNVRWRLGSRRTVARATFILTAVGQFPPFPVPFPLPDPPPHSPPLHLHSSTRCATRRRDFTR